METTQIEVKTLLLCTAAIFCIEVLAVFINSAVQPNLMILTGIIRLSEIIFIILIVSNFGRGISSFGLSRSKIADGLKRGLVWTAGFGLIAAIVGLILWAGGKNPLKIIHSSVPSGPIEIGLLFVIGGLIGPVAEELFFRGILYGFFRRWGIPIALILSTLIFVIFHPVKGMAFTQIIGGIVFAVAYEIEGSLLVPITIHALGNITIFSLSFLS